MELIWKDNRFGRRGKQLIEDDMEYIPYIASAIAIVISVLSLMNSWRAQRRNQMVSFEQRKQEVRQILFEGQITLGEINNEMNREWFRNTNVHDNTIDEVAVTRDQCETALKNIDGIPSTPSTEARLSLEQMGGAAIRIKNKLREHLTRLRDASQTIEKMRQDNPE